jgi:D-alanine--poly(phosphoribitol) ligase subunit 1
MKNGTAQSLAAFVVLAGRDDATHFELSYKLRNQLSERLPVYMLPRKFVFLDTFPMTANGKVDRGTLAKSL